MHKKIAVVILSAVIAVTAVGVALAVTTKVTGKATSVSISKNTITIWKREKGNETLKIASNAKITFEGKEVLLNRIVTPANVILETEKQKDGKILVKVIKAEKIKILSIIGIVNAISANDLELVVLLKDNTTKTIKADSKTVIKRNDKIVQFKDIKEKDTITSECIQEYDGQLYCKNATCQEDGKGEGTGGGCGDGGGCGCGGGCGSGGGCCP